MTRKSTLEVTYLIEMATSPKSSLWGPGGQDGPYNLAIPRRDALQLSLLPHEKWYSASLAPTTEPRTQPNSIKPSRSWPNKRKGPKSTLQPHFPDKSSSALVQRLIEWQQWEARCLSVLLKKIPGILPQLIAKVDIAHLLHCTGNSTSYQELFLLNRREPPMARKHEIFPLLDQG